jgi:hypothetical protein
MTPSLFQVPPPPAPVSLRIRTVPVLQRAERAHSSLGYVGCGHSSLRDDARECGTFFCRSDDAGGIGDHREFAASGTATGIGDVLLRAKGTVMRRGQNAIAVGEVRVPSGDEDDRVLNSPQLAVTPFVARGDLGSGVFQDITFHFPVRILCDQQTEAPV